MARMRTIALIAAMALIAPLATAATDPFEDFEVVKIKKGPNALVDLKTALLTAAPGTIIQLPKTTIEVDEELSISTDHIVIRGKGEEKSILDFTNQSAGGNGFSVTGDYVTFEDLAIVDTPGDGIRAQDVRGITFRDIRVEWTGGPSAENGAYGVYPVLCEDVLIEGIKVIGASDAGIYVGQSNNIIVRKNTVKDNVAGIEIENSTGADVFKNKAIGNTGGILVFNLPGLSMLGSGTRVYKNLIKKNNEPNFGSGIVAEVPAGTGIIVLANDDVEIFNNKIIKNGTAAISIASYNVVGGSDDSDFDVYAEGVNVHDNEYEKNGLSPDGTSELAIVIHAAFAPDIPEIFLALDVDPEKEEEGGGLPVELETCVSEKKAEKKKRFGELNLAGILNDMEAPVISRLLGSHDCTQDPLPKIVIPDAPPVPDEEMAAACVGGDDAFMADCPKISDYGLFASNDPREPLVGGLPYDLTAPLFTDYATKYRVAFVPDEETASVREDGLLDFPVGTILAKTFTFAEDLRNPNLGESLVETRLLIHRPSGWVGLPYIWNFSESEAYLSVIGGAEDVSFTFYDGSTFETHYRIPNKNQCVSCHFEGPIGPKVRLMNRDYDYESGTENQLDHWLMAGVLPDAPEPEEAPRLPFFDDEEDGTLEERARAYIETNCAHCHNPLGSARNTGLFFEYDRALDSEYGVCKVPVAAGFDATDGRPFDITPGSVEDSIVPYRMDSLDPNVTMPEIGRSLIHTEGVELVEEWIESLPEGCI